MQLTISTDYSIRVLLILAGNGRLTSLSELSKASAVTEAYLLKLIKKLKSSGFMKSYNGVNGGYELAMEPKDISLFDIIDTVEQTTRVNRCLEEDHYCSRLATGGCPVRKTYQKWQQLQDHFLQSVTLEDLINENQNPTFLDTSEEYAQII